MDKEDGKTGKERSDIGGFSLSDSSFEGTGEEPARGLFEHGLLFRAASIKGEDKVAA